ncbi:MAG: hypothetical protein WBX22_12545 [Silvibacterium sp.]|jgi:hypothetical protein
MHKRAAAVFVMTLLLTTAGFAKDKKKNILPAYVLRARTVAVIIDPTAGVSVDDPRANQVAQKDVEAALLSWGRYEPVLSTQFADLVIVVRKGSSRLAGETISDPRQNDRGGVINSTDSGINGAAQIGRPPNLSSGAGSANNTPGPQMEIGGSDDSFIVYQGGVANPLDSTVAWRYVRKDGLQSPSVPAVDEFRKAVAEADKAAAKNP